MPGTSDSKFEAIGPVSVDIAPVLMVLDVTPGEPVAAAHAALVCAAGRTAAVALVAGTITTAPAAMTVHATAPAARRVTAPLPLVFIASPSLRLVLLPLIRSLRPESRSDLRRSRCGHCSCRASPSTFAAGPSLFTPRTAAHGRILAAPGPLLRSPPAAPRRRAQHLGGTRTTRRRHEFGPRQTPLRPERRPHEARPPAGATPPCPSPR